ncbi:hypothetical protein RJ55_08590 [Drechmeria coniospora]|nr:hypothetical protein RJ55_08590 [Drechmeria coniospora]
MVEAKDARRLRIGVDVGGTNTDGVILDPQAASTPGKGILAWHKAPTTANPSDGINNVIDAMFQSAKISPNEVASVTIGTTHFVNAVVERDAARLSKVAVVRLCGPFSKHVPPCVDWPDDMRQLILGHSSLLKGGLEVDGTVISDIDPAQIREECAAIRSKGIKSIVVNGVFSPIDIVELQEERAAEIIKAELPDCDVVCSKDIANLGFLERENASILNASILAFARMTIRSFQEPFKTLGLRCPIFFTQNDGTVLTGDGAARLPIRTFSSGPTNSMRGAAFLAHGMLSEAVMVVDIGGTTTDVGLLQANGFPRQQAAYSELAGIRMNFSCPDVKSIGLGGGSVVRTNDPLTIGPDSIGRKLTQDSLVFGGNVLTATDCTVQTKLHLDVGDGSLVKGILSAEECEAFQDLVRRKLEKAIDTMKTSPDEIPVLLVGGGAVIAPDELKGASRVLKPKWSQVANAIGAAVARVSVVVDTVQSTETRSTSEWLEEVSQRAIQKTIAAGALPSSVEVVEKDALPLQYIAHKTRFIVRAAGDFDPSRSHSALLLPEQSSGGPQNTSEFENTANRVPAEVFTAKASQELDLYAYRPKVVNRVWYVSETDLSWITTGCYILGTGGGGSPYSSMIRLRSDLRKGAIVRIVHPHDLKDDDQVGCGGGVGSPTVGIEKLAADELMEAQNELYKICPRPATHMIAIEIGGANGLGGMQLAASSYMNVPAVDGDWMGRAYPTKWQTTPVVFNERSPIWSPISMSDGNGNVVVMPKASSDRQVERIMRAALCEMGSHTGCAEAPVSGAETKRWVVEHTISQSWRIGRAVARARRENRVDNVAETIIEECGGRSAGKVLWKGKIIGVERRLRSGYVYGECMIEGANVRGDDVPTARGKTEPSFQGIIKIPFKNENIAVLRMGKASGEEEQADVLAIVPDLITVIDAHNGEAIGTPEYRYGLLVVVLGLAASDKWTSTERGIQLGGPESFGFDHLKYTPLGVFEKPKSVIDEYDEQS